MFGNGILGPGTDEAAEGRGRAFASPWLVSLVALAPLQAALAAPPGCSWKSPFQAGNPEMVRDDLRPQPESRCNGDPYNKCTFSARVDYDGDGAMDIVQMMDGRSVGALVVDFGGTAKRRPLTIASFPGRWEGSCYIEAVEGDPGAMAVTCPESSSGTFKLRNGKPAARWTGD